jgi:hypothetical protein
MRLFELAYSCRLYAQTTEYDVALERLRAATGRGIDLTIGDHRTAVLRWLNAWGCRHLAVQDHDMAAAALDGWSAEWHGCLPAEGASLMGLDDPMLASVGAAFDALSRRPASLQRRRSGSVTMTFGPTCTAKAFFILRPGCFAPWDDPIRGALGLTGGGSAYVRYLNRVRDELDEAAADGGCRVEDLAELVGRPESTPPKLADEYFWVSLSRGCRPPTLAELRQWVAWAESVTP